MYIAKELHELIGILENKGRCWPRVWRNSHSAGRQANQYTLKRTFCKNNRTETTFECIYIGLSVYLFVCQNNDSAKLKYLLGNFGQKSVFVYISFSSGGSTYKSFRRAPPQQDQILSFLHMFSPKSACVGGWRPLQRGLVPPLMGNPGSAP